MTKKILLLLMIALLLSSLLGCGTNEPVAPASSEPEKDTQERHTVSTEETVDPELCDPNRDWEPIDTKYGRLRYPDQFFDYLQTDQTDTDDGVSVIFRASINSRQIDLFEILIDSERADSFGKITGPDGVVREVHLRLFPIEDFEGLSEGETNRVYAMQESLNFVLDHLK